MAETIDTKHIKFHNLSIVIKRIKAMGDGAPAYMADVLMRCMTEDILPLWHEHVSLQDHSLEDLRKLGHPYATRFPVDSFMHPDSEVHQQSGSVMESTRIIGPEISTGQCGCRLVCTSPHYIFLRYGTRYMRMRDPAGVTMRDALPLIQARIKREVKAALVKYLTS